MEAHPMRLLLVSTLLVLCTALPAAAQEKSKPNTLTPKEVADGWILLFDGETTFGWSIPGNTSGVPRGLTAKDGALVLAGRHCAATLATRFHQFELEAEFHTEGRGDASNDALVTIKAPSQGWVLGLSADKAGEWGRVIIHFGPEGAHHRVERPGGTSSKTDYGSLKDYGPLSLEFSPAAGDEAKLFLRNVKLRPLGAKPLLNGKDLAGWKVFPGKKSDFTFEDGAVQVKNGPGDLQTEGKYGNFVLQLECKSNGRHFNSGVFFRCKPNEYQNGYEAQIHNGFADTPKDYVVEEYDPKTHELIGKKKVKSAAIDFGTGAIYRRVPARFQASKDGEWFTMTVVATGNHIATWVNGIQQVDWFDNRPLSDNPRTGCRLEAGHISIQGHDPTTDLSFRNLRIAELPAAK
jgi:hypothetical protein